MRRECSLGACSQARETMVVHVRFESLYISLPSFWSSSKQQLEMTESYVFGRVCATMAIFSCFPLELNAVITYLG